MTDREKLLALLVQGCREERGEDDIPCCEESFCKDNHTSCYGETADYLLAHGVVVQRWIPVAERLPGTKKVLITDGDIVMRGYRRPDGVWKYGVETHEVWENMSLRPVTHWMPLPEPPKEGE